MAKAATEAPDSYITFSGSTLSVIAKSAFLRPFEHHIVKGNFEFSGSNVEDVAELKNVRLSDHGEVRFKSLAALVNFVGLKRKVDLDLSDVGLLVAQPGRAVSEGSDSSSAVEDFDAVLTDSHLVRILEAWSKEGTSRLRLKLQRALKECERQLCSNSAQLQETGAHGLWELGLRGTNHSAISDACLLGILNLLPNLDSGLSGGPDVSAAAAGALWSLSGTVAVSRKRLAELGAVRFGIEALQGMSTMKRPPRKAALLLLSSLLVFSQDEECVPELLGHVSFFVSLVKHWKEETSLSPRIVQLICRLYDGERSSISAFSNSHGALEDLAAYAASDRADLCSRLCVSIVFSRLVIDSGTGYEGHGELRGISTTVRSPADGREQQVVQQRTGKQRRVTGFTVAAVGSGRDLLLRSRVVPTYLCAVARHAMALRAGAEHPLTTPPAGPLRNEAAKLRSTGEENSTLFQWPICPKALSGETHEQVKWTLPRIGTNMQTVVGELLKQVAATLFGWSAASSALFAESENEAAVRHRFSATSEEQSHSPGHFSDALNAAIPMIGESHRRNSMNRQWQVQEALPDTTATVLCSLLVAVRSPPGLDPEATPSLTDAIAAAAAAEPSEFLVAAAIEILSRHAQLGDRLLDYLYGTQIVENESPENDEDAPQHGLESQPSATNDNLHSATVPHSNENEKPRKVSLKRKQSVMIPTSSVLPRVEDCDLLAALMSADRCLSLRSRECLTTAITHMLRTETGRSSFRRAARSNIRRVQYNVGPDSIPPDAFRPQDAIGVLLSWLYLEGTTPSFRARVLAAVMVLAYDGNDSGTVKSASAVIKPAEVKYSSMLGLVRSMQYALLDGVEPRGGGLDDSDIEHNDGGESERSVEGSGNSGTDAGAQPSLTDVIRGTACIFDILKSKTCRSSLTATATAELTFAAMAVWSIARNPANRAEFLVRTDVVPVLILSGRAALHLDVEVPETKHGAAKDADLLAVEDLRLAEAVVSALWLLASDKTLDSDGQPEAKHLFNRDAIFFAIKVLQCTGKLLHSCQWASHRVLAISRLYEKQCGYHEHGSQSIQFSPETLHGRKGRDNEAEDKQDYNHGPSHRLPKNWEAVTLPNAQILHRPSARTSASSPKTVSNDIKIAESPTPERRDIGENLDWDPEPEWGEGSWREQALDRLALQSLHLLWELATKGDKCMGGPSKQQKAGLHRQSGDSSDAFNDPRGIWSALLDRRTLTVLYSACHDKYRGTHSREVASHVLCLLARHTVNKEIMVRELGSTFLLDSAISFLASTESSLRSCGAAMISRLRLSEEYHSYLRSKGTLQTLIRLGTSGKWTERRDALLGLQNCALNSDSQRALGKHAIYPLMELCWICNHALEDSDLSEDQARTIYMTQLVAVNILDSISRNPANRTPFFKAELRVKEMAGWREMCYKGAASQSLPSDDFANNVERDNSHHIGRRAQHYNETDLASTVQSNVSRSTKLGSSSSFAGGGEQRLLAIAAQHKDSALKLVGHNEHKRSFVEWFHNTFDDQPSDSHEYRDERADAKAYNFGLPSLNGHLGPSSGFTEKATSARVGNIEFNQQEKSIQTGAHSLNGRGHTLISIDTEKSVLTEKLATTTDSNAKRPEKYHFSLVHNPTESPLWQHRTLILPSSRTSSNVLSHHRASGSKEALWCPNPPKSRLLVGPSGRNNSTRRRNVRFDAMPREGRRLLRKHGLHSANDFHSETRTKTQATSVVENGSSEQDAHIIEWKANKNSASAIGAEHARNSENVKMTRSSIADKLNIATESRTPTVPSNEAVPNGVSYKSSWAVEANGNDLSSGGRPPHFIAREKCTGKEENLYHQTVHGTRGDGASKILDQRHSINSPFTVRETRIANSGIHQRMRQPARSMWCKYPLKVDRWTPMISDITTQGQCSALDAVQAQTLAPQSSSKQRTFDIDKMDLGATVIVGAETPSTRKKYYFKAQAEIYRKGKQAAQGDSTENNFVSLSRFSHIPGARVYDSAGISRYRQPDGSSAFFYQSSFQSLLPSGVCGQVPLPPHEPTRLCDLGRRGLPPVPCYTPPVVQDVVDASLSPKPNKPPVPDHFSCPGGQLDTGIMWSRLGTLFDDPVPFRIESPRSSKFCTAAENAERQRAEEEREDAQAGVGKAFDLKASVFKLRMKDADSGTFWEDELTAERCATYDWKILGKKRAFRKFIGRYDEADISSTRRYLASSYSLLMNIYRFYAVLGSTKPFVMQLNDFTKFLNDTQLITSGNPQERVGPDGTRPVHTMPSSASANITEDYCDTLFKQVNFSLPDSLTDDMKRLNAGCDAFKIRKDYDLMRYEFVECLIRLAQAKYISGGEVSNAQEGSVSSSSAADRDEEEQQTILNLGSSMSTSSNVNGNLSLSLAVNRLLTDNLARRLGPESLLDPDDWRNRRLYNEHTDAVFREHDGLLRPIFQREAGRDGSSRLGGQRGTRMTVQEWNCAMEQMQMFNANFTHRESNLVFVLSIMNVVNQVQKWHRSITLTSVLYVDYLEALGRVADMVLIPTQKQLNLVGADTIVEFYTLLDSTGLWESFDANNVARRDESRLMLWDGMRERVYDDRPLHVKLRQFLLLVASMKQRKSRGAIENRFWRNKKKRMLAARLKARSETAVEDEDRSPKYENGVVVSSEGLSREDLESFEVRTATTLHDMWRSARGTTPDGRFIPRIKTSDGKKFDIANLHFKQLPPYFKFENLIAAHTACESIRAAWREHQERLRNAAKAERSQREMKMDTVVAAARDVQDPKITRANGRRRGIVVNNDEHGRDVPGQNEQDESFGTYTEGEDVDVEDEDTDVLAEDDEAFRAHLLSRDFTERASAQQHAYWVKRNRKSNEVDQIQLQPYGALSDEDKEKSRMIVKTAVEVYLAHLKDNDADDGINEGGLRVYTGEDDQLFVNQ